MKLFHKDRFSDAVDKLIPDTKIRKSRTEEEEQVIAYMKKTGRIPLSFMRESDGIHVECSRLFESRIKFVLERGEAIGADGRKYIFEFKDDLFLVGCSICTWAKTEDQKYFAAYSLSFFV